MIEQQRTPRSYNAIIDGIENMRKAMADTTRRLRTQLQNGGVVGPDVLYKEAMGMRAASDAIVDIVDDMCRKAWPLKVDVRHNIILEYLSRKSPAPVASIDNLVAMTNRDEVLHQLVTAGYVLRQNPVDREMLSITDTGKAALSGIMWAQR